MPTRSTDEHARQPYQNSFYLQLADGSFIGGDGSFVVPAGKRLVIERISASALVPTGQLPLMEIFTNLTRTSSTRLFPRPVKLGAWNTQFDQWTADTAGPLYGDAGERLNVNFYRSSSTGPASAFITVSGYLIDA